MFGLSIIHDPGWQGHSTHAVVWPSQIGCSFEIGNSFTGKPLVSATQLSLSKGHRRTLAPNFHSCDSHPSVANSCLVHKPGCCPDQLACCRSLGRRGTFRCQPSAFVSVFGGHTHRSTFGQTCCSQFVTVAACSPCVFRTQDCPSHLDHVDWQDHPIMCVRSWELG